MSKNRHYDVIVIGAGIHGVGVAQAAAARGHSVLVLERNGIASGTSSRSSKLIHGGLRYLENGQLSLVRECLEERTLLLKLAPTLVTLKPFYIPVTRAMSRSATLLRTGLALYSLLGKFSSATRFGSVARSSWGTMDGLSSDNLLAILKYQDAQTDDAALTRAVMASAHSLGAQLQMPALFDEAVMEDDAVVVHYRNNGTTHSCHCQVLVNASGPWVNDTLAKISPMSPSLTIDLVQGTHIIVNGQLRQGIYYMEAPQDRRAVFAMPWQGQILVGTTETAYHGDPAEVMPLEEEKNYLLDVLAHYFPAYRRVENRKIVQAFAGLRVLPRTGGLAFSRPRETILHGDRATAPRILTIYGGKLTAYRKTAEKVMERITMSLPVRTPKADTRTLTLNDPQ
ncbi:MAG: glycerol-3-phosphate dehydrogenase/oxidase [Gammaproteobacteria bacterium]|nr:glycerol-3-phosphate dehydrogenase/oxidase [Gammaproteobacteria bacterium]